MFKLSIPAPPTPPAPADGNVNGLVYPTPEVTGAGGLTVLLKLKKI